MTNRTPSRQALETLAEMAQLELKDEQIPAVQRALGEVLHFFAVLDTLEDPPTTYSESFDADSESFDADSESFEGEPVESVTASPAELLAAAPEVVSDHIALPPLAREGDD
jgi:Asp-tRNA(Asn)/Glu-tRNA(Gln) amidotransferase C subunit